MNKTVDTEICNVTVYDDQALVKRRGVVQLTGEERELVIANLPVTILSESVQVSSTGCVGRRLLEVRTEQTSTREATHPKVSQLSEEISQLEEQRRQGQDVLTLLNLQRNFIKNLGNQYLERLTKSQNSEPLNLTQIGELLDFVGERWQNLSSAIAQQDHEQKQLNTQLQAVRGQFQQLSTPQIHDSFNIIVTLEPLGSGELAIEVSYKVTGVSWQPVYDLHWQDNLQAVSLSYLAQITQNTGEDWLGVALTLSTAQPGVGREIPPITPWYIDLQQPSALANRTTTNPKEHNSPRPTLVNMPFPGIAPEPEPTIDEELERLRAEKEIGERPGQKGIVTFTLDSQATIPSDGVSHKVPIFHRDDYPCRAEYVAMSRQLNFAYLKATVTNPLNGVTLLPGQIIIFRDNTFIGTSEIQNIAPGQDFQIDLGVDDGLKIERYLVERQMDKKLIGSQQREVATYAYRLTVANLRHKDAQVKVMEQLPVSCHSQLKVRLTDANPQVQVGELGVLEWLLTLPSLASQELSYQFTVEYLPEFRVIGLDI
ncbi:mucoidy inhibitor MuiA family protein [Coleofasciculus sp.]|uniref:mucoidy inhibitor MuiA family protein n=1 Tax=Coleofasciculus sp. TaxID=3100458 RepID=UPI0039F81A90